MKRDFYLLRTVFLLAVLFAPSANGQGSSTATLPAVFPLTSGILGGHEFVQTSYIRDPFVRTYLRTGLGFGITPELLVPLVTIGDTSLVGMKGNLLYALLDVEYQQTIRDWLAVRGRVQVMGRMADETPALISQGVTLLTAFDLGWLFRLYRSESFLFSGSLSVKNADMTDVYLQRFIEGIIENGRITPGNRLVQTTPTLRGIAGLQGAYALSNLVGLNVVGDVGYGESADRSSADDWSYSIAATVDINLHQHNGPPVGFLIGVQTRSNPLGTIGGHGTAQTFFGRFGYTGAKEFSLGLDLGYELLPVRGLEDKAGYVSALIDTRLYF
jgi:hypothetical protein